MTSVGCEPNICGLSDASIHLNFNTTFDNGVTSVQWRANVQVIHNFENSWYLMDHDL
jgi:hypothetical protein